MRRVIMSIVLLLAVPAGGGPLLAQSRLPVDKTDEPLSGERLVVFEGFLSPTCGGCRDPALQMDRLAQEYAHRPVVFLEHDVRDPVGLRYSTWWSAYGTDSSAVLPLTMVDSGYRHNSGPDDFYALSKEIVEAGLANPPQAEMVAYMRRYRTAITFSIVATNQSGVTLDDSNAGSLHCLFYEEGGEAGMTGRFVRAGYWLPLDSFPHGETRQLVVRILDLTDVDWEKLRGIALLDYRPGGGTGPFHALQAASATLLEISPDGMAFLVEPGDAQVTPQSIRLGAPEHLAWTLGSDADWIEFPQATGPVTESPDVSVDPAQLAPGWQDASVTMDLLDGPTVVYSHRVYVRAYLGVVNRAYLPVLMR